VIAISSKEGKLTVAKRGAKAASVAAGPLEFSLIDVFTIDAREPVRDVPIPKPVDPTNIDLAP
jgi:hypothetical protein